MSAIIIIIIIIIIHHKLGLDRPVSALPTSLIIRFSKLSSSIWSTIQHYFWHPVVVHSWYMSQGSILGPIFFLIYINDLPNLASIEIKILLYVDDTSIIVTSPNLENFETKIDKIFGDINNWFKVNQLILNYNKTHYLQFNTKNSWDYNLKLNYQGNYVTNSSNTKFLGLIIDDSLS